MEDFQDRLSKVTIKIQLLKEQKDKVLKELEQLREELKREGIEDVSSLPGIIEKKKLELDSIKLKFEENLKKFEGRVGELEGKLK